MNQCCPCKIQFNFIENHSQDFSIKGSKDKNFKGKESQSKNNSSKNMEPLKKT